MFKLLKNFTKKEVLLIICSLLLIVGEVYLELKLPEYMSNITKLIQTESNEINQIISNGVQMLLCALLSLSISILVGYLIATITSGFSLNVRKKMFDKIENLGLEEIKNFKTSSLITRTTNDITQIEMLLGFGIRMLVKAPVTAVWAITKILDKSIVWSTATLIAVVLLISFLIIIMFIVIPKFKLVQKLIDKLNGVTRENLKGIKVIRAFNAENYMGKKFDDVNSYLTEIQLFNHKIFAFINPFMYLIMNGLSLAIYFIGAILITNSVYMDKITLFSDMVVFSSYAMQVIMSFLMLTVIFMMFPRASISAGRINEVLDASISLKNGNKKSKKEVGTVELKNVSFKYPDAEDYLIKNVSFKANKGETIALIGSTGSGKSTLINLVPRFYDVTNGEILVDGINVKEYDIEYLNSLIGYVSQKAIMFDGTIKSNVLFGKSSHKKTKKDLDNALKIAQATSFVSKLDGQENSHISQGGKNVSGGQKQRLSIARAIAKNPEIYIFDDTFSALDFKTDALLRKELNKKTKGATKLIVATRIGTIINADKIIVLDKGSVVGIGNHKELLKSCNIYKQIALSQVSKEELENA